MEPLKIERFNVDGRRAEVHVQEQAADGATERVTSHFEEVVPMEMKKRVSEKVIPVIVERTTEEFNGSEVKKTVEKVSDGDLRLNAPQPVQSCCKENKLSLPKLPSLNLPEGFVYYIVVGLLAVEVAVVVWQLFIR